MHRTGAGIAGSVAGIGWILARDVAKPSAETPVVLHHTGLVSQQNYVQLSCPAKPSVTPAPKPSLCGNDL